MALVVLSAASWQLIVAVAVEVWVLARMAVAAVVLIQIIHVRQDAVQIKLGAEAALTILAPADLLTLHSVRNQQIVGVNKKNTFEF